MNRDERIQLTGQTMESLQRTQRVLNMTLTSPSPENDVEAFRRCEEAKLDLDRMAAALAKVTAAFGNLAGAAGKASEAMEELAASAPSTEGGAA